jgi:T5SS/PEP-CTERM-associated repeat protein
VITGPGSQWINDQNLTIGLNGDVTVDIQDGGYVGTSRDAFIAKNSLHTSTVNVTGAGSHWNIDRNLYVGGSDFRSGGTGTLNIEDGGLVTVANTMTIWSSGTVNVQGGTLDVGTLQQDGTLNVIGGQIAVDVLAGDFILDGGTLAPGDSPGLTSILGNFQFDSGVVEIEIAWLSRGTLFDAVDVSGTALLNGVFDVNLISGFSPLLGDSFLLIDANMLSGTPTFDFSEAVLSQGLGWDTSNFLSTGTISVGVAAIPEPGSAGVLFVTTASLLLNRGSRRRSIRA